MPSTAQVACTYCKNDFDRPALRPYGPGGALTCFKCATESPEREAETNKQLGKRFAAIPPGQVAVIGEGCDNGPEPLAEAMKRRVK